MRLKEYGKRIICLKKLYKQYRNHRKNILTILLKNLKYKGQKKYAIEYMMENPTKIIKQGDLLYYCDKRRYDDTNGKKPNYKDNSRAIELLRKENIPNCWYEIKRNGELYFMYVPELKELVDEKIMKNTKHRTDTFHKDLLKEKLQQCNYKCELTGLSVSDGNLSGDHWIPKYISGTSESKNCIILHKILNEKKNKHDPIEWFCKSLLTNFFTICKKVGMDIKDVKKKLIHFIQEY